MPDLYGYKSIHKHRKSGCEDCGGRGVVEERGLCWKSAGRIGHGSAARGRATVGDCAVVVQRALRLA